MKKTRALLLCVAAPLLLQGCGIATTKYESSYDNVQLLRQQAPLQVVDTPQVKANPGLDRLSIRTNPLSTPSGRDLTLHVKDALEGELKQAGLLQADARRKLDVLIVENKLDAAMGTGHGVLAATFTLSEEQKSLYQSTKRVESNWESSFVGAVAIPRAANAFNPLVQKLLAELYADPAFIQALRK